MFARKGSYAAAYTAKTPSRDEELQLLVGWIAQQSGSGLLLVGPLANSLENSTLASKLVKRRDVDYVSERQWAGGSVRGGRVIGLWPTAEMLEKLHDRTPDGGALGVLTWNETDVATWAAGVGAVDLLGGGTTAPPAVDDTMVLGALRSLTNSVNLSTGIAHPSDRDKAIETFKRLRSTGHLYDPATVEAWAVAHGWGARHAASLRKMAQEIADGVNKRKRSSGSMFVENISDIWLEVGADTSWKPV